MAELPQLHSDDTRERLLAAGLALFGRHGYDGVTTRMLAAAARVNQSAIPYHFGGKEGVYRAVAEFIAAEMGPRIQSLTREAEQRLQDPATDPGELLVQVVRDLAAASFVPGHPLAWFIFLTREQFHPTPAFDVLYERFTRPGHTLVSRLLALVSGQPEESPENLLLAHALIGAMVAFGSARTTLQRRLGWSESDYEPAQLQAMLAVIEQHCRATVAGLRRQA